MRIIAIFFLVFSCGCTNNNSTLTPIQQVGCDIETAVTTSFVSGVATALSCSNQAAIQTSLQSAFGNANLCSGPRGLVTASQMKAAKAGVMKPDGVIGNLACPIAISAALGFLSNSVPSAWGCSQSASASTLATTLTSLCEAAIPL
jgi:hypothetical protein